MVSPSKIDVNLNMGGRTSDSTMNLKRDSSFNVASDSARNELIQFDGQYASLKEYDSVQQYLPEAKRDGYVVSKLQRQNLILKEKYPSSEALISKILDVFLSS